MLKQKKIFSKKKELKTFEIFKDYFCEFNSHMVTRNYVFFTFGREKIESVLFQEEFLQEIFIIFLFF